MKIYNMPTKIQKVCSKDVNRPAMNAVAVVPGEEKETIWCVATNGHMLAVIKTEGECEGEKLVPASVFPAKHREGLPAIVKEGEKYLSSDKKWEPDTTEEDGPFPDVAQVFPKESEYITFAFDPSLLSTLAEAVGKFNGNHVILFVPRNESGEPVNTAIPVLGVKGIGLLMPMRVSDESENEYKAYKSKFLVAWEARHGSKNEESKDYGHGSVSLVDAKKDQ